MALEHCAGFGVFAGGGFCLFRRAEGSGGVDFGGVEFASRERAGGVRRQLVVFPRDEWCEEVAGSAGDSGGDYYDGLWVRFFGGIAAKRHKRRKGRRRFFNH